MEASNHYEVIVIGGGPAGTTTASFLARQGHRCLLLERGDFPRYSIGESLVPHSHGTLSRLDLLPKLVASDFIPKHSVRFVSVRGDESDPFYFSETIDGDASRTWQVERTEFDQLCLDHAREQGVEVRTMSAVEKVLFDNGMAVGVRVGSGEGTFDLHAKIIVDASGRASVIGNQLGLREGIPTLEKASVWSYYKGGARGEGLDAGETTILILPDRSWAWYIPLANDIISVGIVGSADYLFPEAISNQDVLQREIDQSRPLSERLSGAECVSPVRGARRPLAFQVQQTVGDGWVMVGDARIFLDPIYSSGVLHAFESGERNALCIHEALATGDLSAETLGAAVPLLDAGTDMFSQLIHAFYDPGFSFRRFLDRYPEQRKALIDCLVGDVFKDMTSFSQALGEMTG